MSAVGARAALRARRRWQVGLLAEAHDFVASADPALQIREAVVFGSVARGDFHTESDIDLLVVAQRVPERPADRLAAVGWPYDGRVSPIVWTPAELTAHRRRRNPVAVEADTMGVRVWPLDSGPTGTSPSIGVFAIHSGNTPSGPHRGLQGDTGSTAAGEEAG